MSQLFEHKGAGGKGYSQPEPIASPENIQIPSTLVRSHLPRWPRMLRTRDGSPLHLVICRNFGIDTGFYPLGSCI